VADALAIWLYGDLVALVEQERGRPRLVYTDEALGRYALGTPLLSLSLPLANRRYPQGVVRAFLDGLLPEGDLRRALARDVGVRAEDTYGLIRALGRDCAGALVVQPAQDSPPPPATTITAERLEPADLEGLVEDLRSAPLGAGGRVRVSLAGVQEKLVLTRMPDGSWGRPVDGTPSTHILKPEIAAYPHTVENEALCMRLAKHLGLGVANVETTEVAGRRLIVIERYDRVVGADGAVERIHQEDFCQATATPPEAKYEEDGGPSLRRIAEVLQSAGASGSLEELLQAVTLNVAVGNSDAHGKNFSLLHEAAGPLVLSPSYDLMCTLHYGESRLAMYVDGIQRTDRVSAQDIVAEAVGWGLPDERAREIVGDLLDRAPAALAAACEETHGAPDELVSTIERQLARLRSTG